MLLYGFIFEFDSKYDFDEFNYFNRPEYNITELVEQYDYTIKTHNIQGNVSLVAWQIGGDNIHLGDILDNREHNYFITKC